MSLTKKDLIVCCRFPRGAPPKVTPDYLDKLLSIIEQEPRTLGCPFSNWTAPLLAHYLAEETGICLDESRIRSYLHAHGYELLRPVLTVASPDPEYENKRSRIDPLGQRRAVLGDQRATSDNALFRSVHSQVLEPPEGSPTRKKSIVIDTYRIHFAKPVLALLAAHSEQIELVTRPTYSPQLNPVERFWKHLRAPCHSPCLFPDH